LRTASGTTKPETTYLRRGRSIYARTQILGHSSVRVTEIYLPYLTPEERPSQKTAQV
jgi:hypothetical protein